MLLPLRETYEELVRDFVWDIPQDFNIGRAVSDAWAARAPDRVCLEHFSPDGAHGSLTYQQLADRSSRLPQRWLLWASRGGAAWPSCCRRVSRR